VCDREGPPFGWNNEGRAVRVQGVWEWICGGSNPGVDVVAISGWKSGVAPEAFCWGTAHPGKVWLFGGGGWSTAACGVLGDVGGGARWSAGRMEGVGLPCLAAIDYGGNLGCLGGLGMLRGGGWGGHCALEPKLRTRRVGRQEDSGLTVSRRVKFRQAALCGCRGNLPLVF